MLLVCQIILPLTGLLLVHQISTVISCPQSCNCTNNSQVLICSGADFAKLNFSMTTNATVLILSNVNLGDDDSDDVLLKNKLMDLQSLRVLDLSNNNFTDLPKQTIEVLQGLTKLVMRKNAIVSITNFIAELSRKIRIDLSHNPIHCNCSTINVLSDGDMANLIGNCTPPFQNIELKNVNIMTLDCDPCRKNGPCVDGICQTLDAVNFKCECSDNNIRGKYCDEPENICLTGTFCRNGGTCISNSTTNYTCLCPAGSSGSNCQVIGIEESDGNIIIAIIVPAITFILLAIVAYVYFKKIKPAREVIRSKRKASTASRTRSRSVQFNVSNLGFNQEDSGSTTEVIPAEVLPQEMDTYPHDPNHAKWLPGRRRCSTVLEVEEKMSRQGSVYEGREDKQ